MDTNAASTPFWWRDAEPERAAAPTLEPDCDVAVVGAGYTGLSAALTLARAGRSVQVFDRQRPGEGASTRNGGIASGNLHVGFGAAIERFGTERALALYREGKAAREALRDFIEAEGIDCDFRLTGRFTGAMTGAAYEAQGREADLLAKHLGVEVAMIPRARQHDEVGSDLYHGGLLRADIGHLHPAKLHAAMLARARNSGALVHGETAVLGHARERGGFRLDTARGAVRCGRLIYATNGYTDAAHRWLRRRMVPVKSRIVVTEALSPNLMTHLLPKGRAMGETRKLYRYYRPSPDGTRIVFGCRDATLSRDPVRNAEQVRRGLVEVFPDLSQTRIERSWHGNVAFSREELPLMFEHDGVLHACGYGGSGVVWARWLGEKAALRILGAPEAESAFFGPEPRAIPFYSGRPWFLPAFTAWYAMQDRGAIRNDRIG